jgi:polyhydroxyalkanoate synthesis regulator phasin
MDEETVKHHKEADEAFKFVAEAVKNGDMTFEQAEKFFGEWCNEEQ